MAFSSLQFEFSNSKNEAIVTAFNTANESPDLEENEVFTEEIDNSETIEKIWIKLVNRNSKINSSNELPDSKKVYKRESTSSKNFTRTRISGLAFEGADEKMLWKKELF